MIDLILAVSAFLYACLMVYLKVGMIRAYKIQRNNSFEPTVSVIVAARNEEVHIGACIKSLIRLDYPREKLEAVIVNDGSNDRTREIAEELGRNHPWMKVISASHGTGNLLGKTNAVSQGIEVSHGEILMFTDADCSVPQEWVRETVKCFDEKAGIAGGFTLLESSRTFEGMQALDWIFLFGVSSATAGWGIPLTVIGNNLAVRRSAYDSTGGFQNIPFSVTEDYALVQAILSSSPFEVRFPLNPATLVKSRACSTWKQLFRQKQRWGVGGLAMIWRGKVMMTIGWIFRTALLLSLFYSPPSLVLAGIACLLIADLQFLWKPLERIGRLRYLKYFPAFELYFTLYGLVITLVALLSKNVVWKERHL
jgi:cellulose synthase/poly-beta-1,6-N-acetylglucosamine synthase-like glycosyltransferase